MLGDFSAVVQVRGGWNILAVMTEYRGIWGIPAMVTEG